jgi:hypothetical protein
MALIRQLRKISLDRDNKHLEAECTYAIVTDADGQKLLQHIWFQKRGGSERV